MTEITDMVCRVCSQPLNHFNERGEQYWRHGRSESNYDHAPDPIPRDAIDPRDVDYVCDFCGGGPVVWAYPTGAEISAVLAAAIDTGREFRNPLGRSHYRPGEMRDRSDFEQVSRERAAKPLATTHFSAIWCACAPCGDAVETGDVNRLVTHVRRVRPDYAARPRRLYADHFRPFMSDRKPRVPISEYNQLEGG